MFELKEKINNIFSLMKDEFGYKNQMQAPKLDKIVVSVGLGSVKTDKRKIDLIKDRLIKITGQQPVNVLAKKSIASFKVREGQLSGFKVTLRGDRMHYFFDKLISIVIPRIKDFRGISLKSVDQMGNLTIGVKEHIIFPETGDEELKDIFGLSIVIVSTAKTKKEATAFFQGIGVPLKKEE